MRLNEVEEEISKLGDKAMELKQIEQQNEKRILKSEDNLRDLWNNIKRNNIHIIGVLEEERNDQKTQLRN